MKAWVEGQTTMEVVTKVTCTDWAQDPVLQNDEVRDSIDTLFYLDEELTLKNSRIDESNYHII